MGKKIIIVDDEPSVRTTVKLVLGTEGYDVSEAKNSDDAWKKIGKDKPDLMLLDIMMPGMTPRDLIKRIKADAKLKSIKIIFITAVMGAKEATKDVKGIITTIEKPFKNEVLIATIKKAIG